jgi:hypothetical protein
MISQAISHTISILLISFTQQKSGVNRETKLIDSGQKGGAPAGI